MTRELAEEIHEACHEACLECPQFMSLDDDSLVEIHTGARVRFDSIPKRGVACAIRFWMDEETLWEFGYEECLPSHIKELFSNVDDIMDEALVNYASNLENEDG